MMVVEQTQGCRISFELTKPNQSNQALLVPWWSSLTFFVNSGFDPEIRRLGVTSVVNRTETHSELIEINFSQGKQRNSLIN